MKSTRKSGAGRPKTGMKCETMSVREVKAGASVKNADRPMPKSFTKGAKK